MRLLVALTVILVLFLSFGIYMQHQILKTASQLRESLPLVEEKVKAGHWESARQDTKELLKTWNTIQDTWDLFISHHEIDELELLFARALSFIESKDESSALAELAGLKKQLSHIYRKEIFNLQNVL